MFVPVGMVSNWLLLGAGAGLACSCGNTWRGADGCVHRADEGAQRVQFVSVGLETRTDMLVEHLLDSDQTVHELRVLFGELFALLAQLLDAVGLLVVAYRADIRRD